MNCTGVYCTSLESFFSPTSASESFKPALIRERLEARSYLHRGLTLVFDTPTGKIDLSRAVFSSAETSLRLDPSRPSGTVTLEAPGPGGVTVREVLAFTQADYSFGVDLQVLDAQGQPYRGPERPTTSGSRDST